MLTVVYCLLLVVKNLLMDENTCVDNFYSNPAHNGKMRRILTSCIYYVSSSGRKSECNDYFLSINCYLFIFLMCV